MRGVGWLLAWRWRWGRAEVIFFFVVLSVVGGRTEGRAGR
jgi:hypothetical protein